MLIPNINLLQFKYCSKKNYLQKKHFTVKTGKFTSFEPHVDQFQTKIFFGVTYSDKGDIRKHKNAPSQITAIGSKKNYLNYI